jgi:lipopolysaccharide biosynthesis regulator YciM
MGRRCRVFAFCVLLLLVAPVVAFPQTHSFTNPTIQVQVRYSDGSNAPAGVVVNLGRQFGAPIAEAETDTSGNCRFAPPKPDVYFVRAWQPGYLEASTRVDLQTSQAATARLTLKHAPGHPPPAASSDDSPASDANGRTIPAEARQEFEAGRSALRNGDADEGITHLQRAIELHRQYALAYVLLGTAYNQQKNWKSAQAALDKAIELDPSSEVACFQLGGSLNQLKDYEGAVKILNRGLDLNPESPDAVGAHFELAQAYFALGHWQEAEPHAASAEALQPHFARAHLLMGNIDLKKDDGLAAISEFQSYLNLDPNGPAAASVKDVIPRIQAAILTAKK